MIKSLVSCASIALVFCLSATLSQGQEVYDFDGGGDGTSYSDPNNWVVVTDPNGNPGSGNPATAPQSTTFANIGLPGVVVDVTDPNASTLVVNIRGTGSASLGAGFFLSTGGDLAIGTDPNGAATNALFTMTGGTQETTGSGSDIEVGLSSPGTMNMSGGTASARDDVVVRTDSALNVTGGTLNVGDRLITEDNAIVTNDGGSIIASDDFFFFGNSQITQENGLMEVKDKMRFTGDPNDGVSKLTINGGTVRTEEFHFNITTIDDFRGITEINDDGVLQVIQGDGSTQSELTIRMARDLIAEGVHLTTAGAKPLGAFSVVVPSSIHGTNLTYTQISVVPEPASALMLSLGSLGLLMRRRK